MRWWLCSCHIPDRYWWVDPHNSSPWSLIGIDLGGQIRYTADLHMRIAPWLKVAVCEMDCWWLCANHLYPSVYAGEHHMKLYKKYHIVYFTLSNDNTKLTWEFLSVQRQEGEQCLCSALYNSQAHPSIYRPLSWCDILVSRMISFYF